jgi:hypothetical protein
MNNLINLDDFQNKKSGNKLITEMVVDMGENWLATPSALVPKKIISSYIKKVKDATQVDLATMFGEIQVTEQVINWVIQNLLNVDNLPVDILTKQQQPVQIQPQAQGVPAQTAQEIPAQQEQPQQIQAQGQQGQGQQGQGQQGQGQQGQGQQIQVGQQVQQQQQAEI